MVSRQGLEPRLTASEAAFLPLEDREMVREEGIEPSRADPKSAVLPLDDSRLFGISDRRRTCTGWFWRPGERAAAPHLRALWSGTEESNLIHMVPSQVCNHHTRPGHWWRCQESHLILRLMRPATYSLSSPRPHLTTPVLICLDHRQLFPDSHRNAGKRLDHGDDKRHQQHRDFRMSLNPRLDYLDHFLFPFRSQNTDVVRVMTSPHSLRQAARNRN